MRCARALVGLCAVSALPAAASVEVSVRTREFADRPDPCPPIDLLVTAAPGLTAADFGIEIDGGARLAPSRLTLPLSVRFVEEVGADPEHRGLAEMIRWPGTMGADIERLKPAMDPLWPVGDENALRTVPPPPGRELGTHSPYWVEWALDERMPLDGANHALNVYAGAESEKLKLVLPARPVEPELERRLLTWGIAVAAVAALFAFIACLRLKRGRRARWVMLALAIAAGAVVGARLRTRPPEPVRMARWCGER